ncbi:MAG: ATP-binding cassette domain-containing protein [Woeseia sp.]
MTGNTASNEACGEPRNVAYAVEGRDLSMQYGSNVVIDGVSVAVRRGEILAIVGGSGSGKSTMMRLLAMLQTPTAGTLHVLGNDVTGLDDDQVLPLRRRLGVMFQHGALFGSLTVLENVCVPLNEHTSLSRDLIEELGMMKIALAGLKPDAAALYPNELSGGMRKRAAVARGIALDPEVLFLDEPGSGLDPVSADAMDDLVLELKSTLHLTVILVTHDMNSLWRVADRILLLADRRVAALGTIDELMQSQHEVVQQFFNGRRGRAAGAAHDR